MLANEYVLENVQETNLPAHSSTTMTLQQLNQSQSNSTAGTRTSLVFRGRRRTSAHTGRRFAEDFCNLTNTVSTSTSTATTSSSSCGTTAAVTIATNSQIVSLHSKCGTTGKLVDLKTKYFYGKTNIKWCIYQYRVDFTPDIDVFQRKRLFKKACNNQIDIYIFDGGMLFTPRLLPDQDILLIYDNENEIKIQIRNVGTINRSDHNILQLFNILINKCLHKMKLQLVGLKYYNLSKKLGALKVLIEMGSGYISIRQHEDDTLLYYHITQKCMRKTNMLYLLNVMRDKVSSKDELIEKFKNMYIGCIVLTDYNNCIFRIDDINWNLHPTNKFSLRNGESISFVDYYKSKYNILISNVLQPMFVSLAKTREFRAGMNEIVYLIPELCRLTGITDAERNNCCAMREFAEHTCLSPSDTIKPLKTFAERMTEETDVVAELKKWNLEKSKELVTLNGRQLPQELKIIDENFSQKYSAGEGANCTRLLRNRPMPIIGSFLNWLILCNKKNFTTIEQFLEVLQRTSLKMKLNLPSPIIVDFDDQNIKDFSNRLNSIINAYNPKLLYYVTSNNNCNRYATFKKKCFIEHAIPCQVVPLNTIRKNVKLILSKIIMQMNYKINGAPWSVEIPMKNVMIIGYDVCQDSCFKNKSYGAFVASLNSKTSKYFSRVSSHKKELSNDHSINILYAIEAYKKENGCLPEKIIFYRDGVGDGELLHIFNLEANLIQETLTNLSKKYDVAIKLTFIVVSKRINTCFFMNNESATVNNTCKPLPGTVIDNTVSLLERFDFFIVSQCVRQGIVMPTSYTVLCNDLYLNPEKLQRLTFKLSQMYYNWSKRVQVPAVCLYAHKLAYLTSQFLKRMPHSDLNTTLYYL